MNIPSFVTSYLPTIPLSKRKHFWVVIALYVLGLLTVIWTKPSYLLNIIIVYIPGFVYCLILCKHTAHKILLFGLLSLVFIIPVEILARASNSWDVLSQFPRIADLAPIENVVYALVNFMYPIAFYDYFIEQNPSKKISHRWKYLFLIYGLVGIITGIWFHYFSKAMVFDYWQIGLIIMVPIVILVALLKREIMVKLFFPAVLFGTFYLIHEIVSMQLGHWWWPGNYLATITIMEHVYPLDDFVIWILLSNGSAIGGYKALWD
jgi:hypothetical protein